MSERRSLLSGLQKPVIVTPDADSETVKAAAERRGFGFATQPVHPDASPVRRVRQSVGRTHPLNVRLKPATVATIMEIANGRDIPIAQVIEEMTDAFMRSVTTERRSGS